MILKILFISELIGTVAFAMSGALLGIKKGFDSYGITVLAIITAFGGGMTRDILVGNTPPTALIEPFFTVIGIIAAFVTMYLYKTLSNYHNMLQFFDAIGLAAFAVIGASVATAHGQTAPFVVISFALLTGTGGGTIRDVLAREVPYVFRKEIYAVAAIAGGIAYLLSYMFISEVTAIFACFTVTLALRLYSMKHNLHLKVYEEKEE